MHKKLFVAILLLAALSSCNNNDAGSPGTPAPISPYATAEEKIKEGVTMLREGDLVVRSGQDFASQAFRQFNKTDKSYTHAGVVLLENGYPMIYHIITGTENPDQKLRRDSLMTFVSPRHNFGYAIYRYQFEPGEVESVRNEISNYYKQGVKFDSLFEMQTDDRMYCSEMIYKVLLKTTKGRIKLTMTTPELSDKQMYSRFTGIPVEKVSGDQQVAIDNLYLHPACTLVKKFSFIDTTQAK